MKLSRVRRPSPALVISLIALFVALGGTGYAAIKLPKNSVGTKQLKKNAVTGVKVKNGSLTASDFKAGKLPAGPQGAQGAQGAQGTPGPVDVTFVRGAVVSIAAGAQDVVEADCPDGMTPSGGGVFSQGGTDSSVNSSFPTRKNGSPQPNVWVGFVNNSAATAQRAAAYAVCVHASNVSSNFTNAILPAG